MDRVHQILDTIRYAGLTESEFKMCIPEVKRRNAAVLNWILLVLTGALGALLTVALVPGSGEESNRVVYSGFIVLLLILYLVYRLYFLKHQDRILILSYLFMFTAYAFGIVQATLLGADASATSFCVFLVAVPLMVIDIPIRLTLLTICEEILLLTVYFAVGNKLGDRFVVISSFSCMLLGIGCGYSVQITKFREIRNHLMLEIQRDTDLMTGARSRASYIHDIGKMYGEGRSLGVIFADVNGLKMTNDTKGHEAGDRLIREAFEVLLQHYHEPGDRIYRIGGDEFVVISTDDSEVSFRKRFAAMARRNKENEIISCGCIWMDEDRGMESAVMNAEKLMYAEKEKYYRLHPECDRRSEHPFYYDESDPYITD